MPKSNLKRIDGSDLPTLRDDDDKETFEVWFSKLTSKLNNDHAIRGILNGSFVKPSIPEGGTDRWTEFNFTRINKKRSPSEKEETLPTTLNKRSSTTTQTTRSTTTWNSSSPQANKRESLLNTKAMAKRPWKHCAGVWATRTTRCKSYLI